MKSKEAARVTLSDEELIEKCRKWLNKIFKIADDAQLLNAPSDCNNDPNALLFELIRRYKKLSELIDEVEDIISRDVLLKFSGKEKGLGAINGKKMKEYFEQQD